MDNTFNFELSGEGTLTRQCQALGISDFIGLTNYIKALPYGRNSNRADFGIILKEHKGTCSTKHAFLKQVAIEHAKDSIQLCIGIYKMNGVNTKGVGETLKHYGLDYIPEAHTYLKVHDQVFDYTSPNSNTTFYADLLYEASIRPEDIGSYKVELHQDFLKQWIPKENIPYSFEELWAIREQCILDLSQ